MQLGKSRSPQAQVERPSRIWPLIVMHTISTTSTTRGRLFSTSIFLATHQHLSVFRSQRARQSDGDNLGRKSLHFAQQHEKYAPEESEWEKARICFNRRRTLSITFARWLYKDTPSLDSFCRNCLDPSYEVMAMRRVCNFTSPRPTDNLRRRPLKICSTAERRLFCPWCLP